MFGKRKLRMFVIYGKYTFMLMHSEGFDMFELGIALSFKRFNEVLATVSKVKLKFNHPVKF